MFYLAPKYSRDFPRLLFMSLWFDVLVYSFSHALSCLVLDSFVLSVAIAVRLTCITIPDCGHFDHRTLLCNFSGRISSSLQLPDLIEVPITDLPKQLGITAVGLMNMEEKRSRLYPETLRFGSSLWSASRLINLLRNGTHFFFCAPVPNDPKLSEELQEIQAAYFSLVYGLQAGFRYSGMLLLAPKKDGRGYDRRDVQVFSTLVNHVTVAIENAPHLRVAFRK